MANSKNTIQIIPLAGNLNLNTLKTDVSQFEGYNEKNSTVFGGALNPFWEKTSELFDKDTSFSFFNNKGECYSLVKEDSLIKLYKGAQIIADAQGTYVTETVKLDVPSDTVVALRCPDNKVVYVRKNGGIFADNAQIESLDFSVFDAQLWYNNEKVYLAALSEQKWQFVVLNNYITEYKSTATDSGTTLTGNSFPLFTGGKESSEDFTVYISFTSGQIRASGITSALKLVWDNNTVTSSTVTTFGIENINGTFASNVDLTAVTGQNTLELQQFTSRLVETVEGETYHVGNRWVGVQSGFVPCPVGTYTTFFSVYYSNGALISIGSLGEPIDSSLDYGRDMISVWKDSDTYSVTYQRNSGEWFSYKTMPISTVTTNVQSYLEQMLFDNHYVFFKNNSGLTVFDIETDTFVNNASYQDWVISEPPYSETEQTTTTGSMYGAGFNAGYEVSNARFVGLLPDLYFVSNSPDLSSLRLPDDIPDGVQYYCSTGDTVSSAVYFGRDPQYFGTPYAVYNDDNIILPVSLNAEIIPGYSNNDLVREGGTVFPLRYWNNTQKTYTYYKGSAIENMNSVFSLQGQSYAVDDQNIYATSFDNGIVSNVTPVCYKKNMTFLGTLPTQAIFWSSFNKTFYAFTGDRILSKMFEASDIDEIYYVGQNPSSLSLWFCTNSGIYIMSETDMYKLDFVSHYVSFHGKFAYILVDGETNKAVHAITLYKDKDETDLVKVPIKLATKFYGLGAEKKAVLDCWYIRVWDKDHTAATIKVRDTTITDVTKVTHEKPYRISKDDYDNHDIAYIRHQPQFQECVAMQLELESPISIYSLAVGVTTTDVAQISKLNF